MKRNLDHFSLPGANVMFEYPNVCPHCHVTIKPNLLWGAWLAKANQSPIISAWKCINTYCKKVFVVSSLENLYEGGYVIERFMNGLPKGPNWPKPIQDLKSGGSDEPSKFIKTYLQSLVAESDGLDEIAGMGYRKAIEYLVKDWAIQSAPDDQAKIESLWLGQIISQYFKGDLKDILERATWLGNDQAHYNRLFEEFDLDVLKELIELIMVELDRQHKLNHYINEIQKRK